MTDIIYFERQVSLHCAQHSLNMLMQEPIFTITFLQEVARELDRREQAVLSTEARFQSENADRSGFFSIQVIQMALQIRSSIRLLHYDSPNARNYRNNPSIAKAYLINSNKHWFAARKFASKHWFLLNSLHNGPQYIDSGYLDVYLPQLHCDEVAIFVVVGDLRECFADSIMGDFFNPLWNIKPMREGKPKYERKDDIAEAIRNSLLEEAKRREDQIAEESALAIASKLSREMLKEEDALALVVELSMNPVKNGSQTSACATK